MPEKSNNYPWKFYLLALGLLVAEFLLIWEAKLILYYRDQAIGQKGRLGQVVAETVQRTQEAESDLNQVYSQRLNSLLATADEDFGPLVSCGSTWLEYETKAGHAFRYPEGMKVTQTNCAEEDCCGSGFELTYPGRDEFELKLFFTSEEVAPVCQGEECVSVREYLPTFPEIKLYNLPSGWEQQTTDQLNGLWGEDFEVLIRFKSSSEGACIGWLKASYQDWAQRMVVLRVAQSLSFGEILD